MNKAVSFVSGLLIGSGIAALATLFLAPRSGTETRELISEKGIELKERVQEVTTSARKSSDDIAGEIERELDEAEDKLDART